MPLPKRRTGQGKSFDVALYSPDRHVEYDGTTPYMKGIGGGITARIRMARALARAGQEVRVLCNCPQPEVIDGVAYIPLDQIEPMNVDVLIANTSGDRYDLSPLLDLPVTAYLRLVWMSGTQPPVKLEAVPFDAVYAKSNFLLDQAKSAWNIPPSKIWVFYNGFDEFLYTGLEKSVVRDPYRLVYFSHPSKGLETALEITRRLHARDARFHLVICGGEALWGQPQSSLEALPFIQDRGILPQPELTRVLLSSSFSLVLQDRLEPFGMVVTESQRAGCIVLGSPVGAISELIDDGVNGLIIPGDFRSEAALRQAVEAIIDLIQSPDRLEGMRLKARSVPWNTDLMARAWLEHWRALLAGDQPEEVPCPWCGRLGWRLADGVHCQSCRRYTPAVDEAGAE